MSTDGEGSTDQYACTAHVLDVTPEALVVSNLGVASYALAAVEDRPRNFYLWGSMGVTTPIGLGLATAVDAPVTVLEGDGSLLMSLGALATVSRCDPANLTIVLWDNAAYATTGGQSTQAGDVDFAAVAANCGVASYRANTTERFREAYRNAVEHDGASFVACDVAPVDPDARPPLDFAHVKRRFRDAVAADRE